MVGRGCLGHVSAGWGLTVYRPNFCSQCGTKLLRLRWHIWTSRRFCDECARRLRKERYLPRLLAALALITAGYSAARVRRPQPPPLTIVRRADSPLSAPEDPGQSLRSTTNTTSDPAKSAVTNTEDVYLCGARTKKGTPCSRRVHGPLRCWQHKGMPSIIPVVPIK
jgi:hypothetical protein